MTRRDLDVALEVAEGEPLLGLPEWGEPLALDGDEGGGGPGGSGGGSGEAGAEEGGGAQRGGFRLRRVEVMCRAHAAAAAAAVQRLAVLKVWALWWAGLGAWRHSRV